MAMSYCKTVKLKAYTTRAGYAQVDAVLNDLRLLYNAAREERRTAYRAAGVSITRNHQEKELTAIRAQDPAFDQVNRRLQVEVLTRLHLAFQAFSRRVRAGETPGLSPSQGTGALQDHQQPSRGPGLVQVQRQRGQAEGQGVACSDRAGRKSGDSRRQTPGVADYPEKAGFVGELDL